MRSVARFCGYTALGVIAGLALLVTAPRLVGVTPFTVLSGSMTPTLGVGDVVLDERVAPADVRRGDIVTFPDASRGGAMVTHRVERMWRTGADVSFVTRGDANTAGEEWRVPAGGKLGRVRMAVPKVGWVLHRAGSREGRLALVALPAALLVLLELGGLLRAPRKPEGAPA